MQNERHEFCDSCPGCRPAILDIQTQRPLANDSPTMIAVNRIWDNDTTYAQRKAFIEVTLHNSRLPDDLRLTEQVVEMIKKGMQDAGNQ